MFFPMKPPFLAHVWHRFLFFVKAAALLLLLLMTQSKAGAKSTGSPANAVQATPEPVLTFFKNLDEWRITSGFIYLTDTCGAGETTAYIRRRAVNGTNVSLLESVNNSPQCRTFIGAAADASGIYYYNRNLGRIEAIYSQSPNDPPTPLATIGDWTTIGFGDGISALKLDGSYVYWIEATYQGEFDPAQVRIMRVSKSGGVPSERYSYTSNAATQVSFEGLGVTRSHIWWIDGDGLNRIPSCTLQPCLPGPLIKTLEFPISISAVEGYIHISGTSVYWWNREADRERIRRTSCTIFGSCSTASVHLPASGVTVIGLASDNKDVYWTEDLPLIGRRLRRISLAGGAAETLAEGIAWRPPFLEVDGVYFQTTARTISRLPLDASAITHQFSIAGWEVTQGIQSLDNDVPLVAGKETYVRVFPRLDAGDPSRVVEARLYGSRGGVDLPGSPLLPENYPVPVFTDEPLRYRGNLNWNWLFKLPASWTKVEAGSIPRQDANLTLRVVLDPRGLSGDTTPANNELADDFVFTAKAPICMTLVSVLTSAPYQATYDISTGLTVEMAERMLPTVRILKDATWMQLKETQYCTKDGKFGPYCEGPYELDDDASDLLTLMVELDSLQDDPTICGDTNARTLFGGIVHQDSNWDAAGIARLGTDVFLSKVPVYGSWSGPFNRESRLATTLAHETAHDLNRMHIDCGDPARPDANYPYDPCVLDDGELDAAGTHWGFDEQYWEVIDPSDNADFLSYARDRWISDYTWKGIFNTTDPASVASQLQNPFAAADSHAVTLASGQMNPASGWGRLIHVVNYPTAEASAGLLEKWAATEAPVWGAQASTPYHLRLLDGGGQVLDDREIELSELDDVEAQTLPFLATFPTPNEPVAKLQLMSGQTLLYELIPSSQPPVISILSPAGNETVDRAIILEWMAQDANVNDQLHFSVQYSPDQGASWDSLVANRRIAPENGVYRLKLDLSGQSGSNGATALLRLLASDGYNTALATSEPFQVEKRAPLALITAPQAGQWLPAGQTLRLRGSAHDPEDGELEGNALDWTGTGIAGSGQTLDVEGLAPGVYSATLLAEDSDGQLGMAQVDFNIAPLEIPMVDTAGPILDGWCQDSAYLDATGLSLAAYPDGSRPSALLARTSSYLWVCLFGLQGEEGLAGLLVDVDHSQDDTAQPGDFGFFVKPDGTPAMYEGQGGGGYGDLQPGSLAARIAAKGGVWSAELRIQASAIGGWDRQVGLAAGHYDLAGGTQNSWPKTAGFAAPDAWGAANLGETPAIASISPVSATIGGGDVTLTIQGSGFGEESMAFWNGVQLGTTLVSTGTLQANLTATLLTEAGLQSIHVANPAAPELPSTPVSFLVLNPQPTITRLSPDMAQAGEAQVTMIINGSNFVDGASVLWNGQERAASFVNNNQLELILPAADLMDAQIVSLVVANPTPAAGVSNVRTFTIQGDETFLYLPVIFIP